MKNLLTCIMAIVITASAAAQRYYTKSGKIIFDATSSSSPEKIEGTNRTVTCVMDAQTGAIQFALLMKGFEFERALMEEHFNENYVESTKFPKAEFKGKLKDIGNVNLTKDGVYTVKVKGELTMHGQTREVETDAKIQVQGGKISANADFSVTLADFNVSIPGLVADKVSKVAKIKVNCSLEPLKS